MSGICGIINFDGAPADPALLEKMAQAAVYRGPDGIHYWVQGNVGLAHLALHTTPESLRERQPLHNARGNLTLVADARIDNRDELIPFLAGKGFVHERDASGNTPTDADLILAAYECWGEDCPKHLLGDFVFVVWDARERKIFAARDALGVKPLHYCQVGQTVCLATEAQMILQHPVVPDDLDFVSLGDYLTNNCSDEERTFFKAVRWLPAAHFACFSPGEIKLVQYWVLDSGKRIQYQQEDEYSDHYRQIFSRVVSDRLRTQASKVGLLVSGGLDSCSIAAMIQNLRRQAGDGLPELAAFSYAFDKLRECDERVYSQVIARGLNFPIHYVPAEHFWIFKDPTTDRPDRDTPVMSWRALDQHIFQTMREQGANVFLTGLTTFFSRLGGNRIVFAHRLLRGDLKVLKEFYDYAQESESSLLNLFYTRLVRPLIPQRLFNKIWYLLGKEPVTSIPIWLKPEFVQRANLKRRLSKLDVPWRSDYMVRDMFGSIRRGMYICDCLGAQNGLEGRHPFLDRRLVEYLMAIPPAQGYRPGMNRWILRQAMRDLMPEIIRLRASKTNFQSFYGFSLHQEEKYIRNLLAQPCLGDMGLVDVKILQDFIEEWFAEQQLTSVEFWYTITLELWMQIYQMNCLRRKEDDHTTR